MKAFFATRYAWQKVVLLFLSFVCPFIVKIDSRRVIGLRALVPPRSGLLRGVRGVLIPLTAGAHIDGCRGVSS